MTRSPADVVIIGAGVVGTAIARTLAAYSLDLVLVDAASDVGTGTSKANTAILHTGFDAKPGSLESRLLSRGSGLLRAYASAARIAVERTGALLVAWTPDQVAALPGIEANARRNGYLAMRPLAAAELYAREPALGPGALGGLEIPDESIICPWTTPLAFATEAVAADVRLVLSARVTGVAAAGDGSWELATTRGPSPRGSLPPSLCWPRRPPPTSADRSPRCASTAGSPGRGCCCRPRLTCSRGRCWSAAPPTRPRSGSPRWRASPWARPGHRRPS